MGFGVSGATGILLVGAVIHLGVLSASYFSLEHTVQAASRVADMHAVALRQGNLQIDNHSYDGGSQVLRVNVTNTGSVTFNASRADLVLDGDVQTSAITSLKVGNATTSVWAPATRLEITATAAQDPVAIIVVAPTGAAAYWRL
jgi:archaellum component FlaF (FlaF/FlaG flagellin family)